jgi:GDP-4-dehydro-6-deoxy-D-mannose reductase
VLTRSFNHIGPGQRDIFVISSFARQLVEIRKNGSAATLTTGNLAIIRDFLDVRDVVRAYDFLFNKGRKGELYNICSGHGVSLEQIVQNMMKILDLKVTTQTNANLIRPSDNPVIVGSNKKIKSETGWEMQYSLEQSLKDIIQYWNDNI